MRKKIDRVIAKLVHKIMIISKGINHDSILIAIELLSGITAVACHMKEEEKETRNVTQDWSTLLIRDLRLLMRDIC